MKDADFFELDPNRLDEEWCNQPRLYHAYATKLAHARKTHEEAKASRDIVSAEIEMDVRKNPEKYGLAKITEESVKKAVTLSSRYALANQEVIETRHDMDVVQAAVDTLDHRKKALENLVQLWSQNYFSEPKKPKLSQEKQEELDEKIKRQTRRGTR